MKPFFTFGKLARLIGIKNYNRSSICCGFYRDSDIIIHLSLELHKVSAPQTQITLWSRPDPRVATEVLPGIRLCFQQMLTSQTDTEDIYTVLKGLRFGGLNMGASMIVYDTSGSNRHPEM